MWELHRDIEPLDSCNDCDEGRDVTSSPLAEPHGCRRWQVADAMGLGRRPRWSIAECTDCEVTGRYRAKTSSLQMAEIASQPSLRTLELVSADSTVLAGTKGAELHWHPCSAAARPAWHVLSQISQSMPVRVWACQHADTAVATPRLRAAHAGRPDGSVSIRASYAVQPSCNMTLHSAGSKRCKLPSACA